MNPLILLRDSFRITFRAGTMWFLACLLYLVMIPALLMAGGMGAVLSYGMMPAQESSPIAVDLPLRDFSIVEWVLFLALTLCLLTVSSLLSWAVQAAMIRAADAAAEEKPVTVLSALQLGRQRWGSLLKLSLTFGLVIQALGILPSLVSLFLRESIAGGAALLPLIQTFFSPVNILLGIPILNI